MPEISVIIPVYNTSAYLQECVDSVLSQTFQDFEIIIVDDCSTDGSMALCRKLYGNNSKVTIIHHEQNGTVGTARNTGLKASKGKYIAFLDSDDLYMPYALEELYKAAEAYQAEVVHSPDCFLPNGNVEHIRTEDEFRKLRLDKLPLGTEIQLLGSEKAGRVQAWADKGISTVVWSNLFRRDFLAEHDIWFEEDIVPGQDGIFMFRCVFHAHTFVRIPDCVYIYRRPASAVTRSKRDGKFLAKLVHCMVRKIESLERYMAGIPYLQEHPELQDKVRNFAIADTDSFFAQDCYLPDGTVAGDIEPVHQAFKNIFGQHAYFAEHFFHASHKKQVGDVAEWGLRMNYMFPWHLFKQGDKVVLYGAGEVGKGFYEQALRFPYIKLVGIVDKQAGKTGMQGIPAKPIDNLTKWDYDYLLITVVNKLVAEEIKSELKAKGISEEKILWDGKNYPIEDYFSNYYFPILGRK